MGVVFNADIADFADLGPRRGVYTSDAEHEAVVQVDARGIVATGATTLQVVAESVKPPPIGMTMNRPSFYAIVDGKTVAIRRLFSLH
jgi:serine protease inhibitor